MHDSIETLTSLFFTLLRIRRVEEAIAEHYKEMKMRTPVHLSIGQEAVATAIGHHLHRTDFAVSTHRAHAHYLAKGGCLLAMIAEMHGKVTGCCRGRGGSMHLIDQAAGFMGSTAIVGNTIPIGVGLGLSIKLLAEKRISCIFLGDGAVEEGVFFESVNFAVLKQLPVLFVCENNQYSVYSPFEKRQPPERKIYKMVKEMGMPTVYADGYDLRSCFEIAEVAVQTVREKGFPYFIEFDTWRWRQHCGPDNDDDLGYRDPEKTRYWQSRDPVILFREYLSKEKNISPHVFDEMENRIVLEINDAFEQAEAAPWPDPREAISGQYMVERADIKEEFSSSIFNLSNERVSV